MLQHLVMLLTWLSPLHTFLSLHLAVTGSLTQKTAHHREDRQGKGDAPADGFRPLHSVLTYWQPRALHRALKVLEAIDHDCWTEMALPAYVQQTQRVLIQTIPAADACCLNQLMLPEALFMQRKLDSLEHVYFGITSVTRQLLLQRA